MELKTYEQAKEFYRDWEGWYCDLCGEVISNVTKDMISHLKTHSDQELEEYLKDVR